jgi:HD-GYP domain-containing protein (c-di-GMP phosphodiesterase class II)
MFHDVGMTRLSEAALARWNQGHNEDDPEWRAHVQLGYDMVKDHLDPTAAAVVLHHHQRWDGTGFPKHTEFSGVERPVAGSDIHVFARICAAADLFDRLRHPAHAPGSRESTSPSIPAVRALRLMRSKPHVDGIDPVIFRALVTVAPPFPPGTVVELSDGRRAAVVLVRPADPCRPVVEIVDPMAASARRKRPRAERVDLAKGGIGIARAEGHDVAGDLFFAKSEGELDLARTARAMWGGEAA